MSNRRGFTMFLIGLLAPFVLVLIGAGLMAVGLRAGWGVLAIAGLVVAGAGVLWGVVLVVLHGPLDWP